MNKVERIGRVLWRTLLHALPTAIGIVILVFFLLQLVPGDAVDVLAGESGNATEATMAHLRAQFGLDQPILQQLSVYLGNLAQFSLGFSPRYNAPVMDLILSRLPGTLFLMLLSQVFAIVIGITLGTIMAVWAGKWPDRLISLIALLPITTVAGMHFGNLLGGAAVVETVFSWPGLGRLALEAVMARDFNVLLGVLLLSAFLVILANVLVDLLQSWLDPRIKAR